VSRSDNIISTDAPNAGLPSGRKLPRVPVLGGLVTPLDLDATVRLLLEMVKSGDVGYVCVVNVHTTTLAVRDTCFRRALNGCCEKAFEFK